MRLQSKWELLYTRFIDCLWASWSLWGYNTSANGCRGISDQSQMWLSRRNMQNLKLRLRGKWKTLQNTVVISCQDGSMIIIPYNLLGILGVWNRNGFAEKQSSSCCVTVYFGLLGLYWHQNRWSCTADPARLFRQLLETAGSLLLLSHPEARNTICSGAQPRHRRASDSGRGHRNHGPSEHRTAGWSCSCVDMLSEGWLCDSQGPLRRAAKTGLPATFRVDRDSPYGLIVRTNTLMPRTRAQALCYNPFIKPTHVYKKHSLKDLTLILALPLTYLYKIIYWINFTSSEIRL